MEEGCNHSGGQPSWGGGSSPATTDGLGVFQLLNSNVVNDLVLLETLMDSMTARLRDSSTVVRMLALRGLGNVASGSPEKVRSPGLGGHVGSVELCRLLPGS